MKDSTSTRPTETENRADIYQRITNRIAAAIEAGTGEWRMPWHPGADGATPVLPVNAVTGRPYRGVNTVVLWTTAQAEGYPSAVWATYRQWAELGTQVRKGERASPVVFWKISDKEEQEDADEGAEVPLQWPGAIPRLRWVDCSAGSLIKHHVTALRRSRAEVRNRRVDALWS